MKNIVKTFVLLILLSNCKDAIMDSCEGPNCPLPNGTYCPGNLINVNNNCVCPDGSIMLNDSLCYDTAHVNNFISFYGFLDCQCIESDVIFSFENIDNSNFSGGISLNENFHPQGNNRVQAYINLTGNSNSSNFDGSLYPFSCDGRNLKIHGSINNDTLTYFFYFTNPADTCNINQIVAL